MSQTKTEDMDVDEEFSSKSRLTRTGEKKPKSEEDFEVGKKAMCLWRDNSRRKIKYKHSH